MTEKLETVLEKISTIPNHVNSSLIEEFYQFMTDNRIIEENVNYQKCNFILPFNNKSHKIRVY
jgi:hypothetical protein